MEKTAQFSVESVDSLVQRFQANGLETINLGLLCFRFAPALRDEPDFRTDKDIQNDTDEKRGTGRGQLHYWMVF